MLSTMGWQAGLILLGIIFILFVLVLIWRERPKRNRRVGMPKPSDASTRYQTPGAAPNIKDTGATGEWRRGIKK